MLPLGDFSNGKNVVQTEKDAKKIFPKEFGMIFITDYNGTERETPLQGGWNLGKRTLFTKNNWRKPCYMAFIIEQKIPTRKLGFFVLV